MARVTINGLGIEYEFLGDKGAPAVAITPGGRFSIRRSALPIVRCWAVRNGPSGLSRPGAGPAALRHLGKDSLPLKG